MLFPESWDWSAEAKARMAKYCAQQHDIGEGFGNNDKSTGVAYIRKLSFKG